MIPITTERLILRNFEDSDFERLHAIGSDSQVTRFTSFGPNTLEETRIFLQSAVSEIRTSPRQKYSLAIQFIEDDVLIGSGGLAEPNHGQYEIGYVLAKSHWGRGLATEFVVALAAFAFKGLKAEKLWAPVDASNRASCRVLEKAGFQLEGMLRQDRMKWPEGRDTKMYGLISHEWPTLE